MLGGFISICGSKASFHVETSFNAISSSFFFSYIHLLLTNDSLFFNTFKTAAYFQAAVDRMECNCLRAFQRLIRLFNNYLNNSIFEEQLPL